MPARKASKAKAEADAGDGAVHVALRQLEKTKSQQASSVPPKKRLHDMVFSDEEEDEENDEESWTFNCLCGTTGQDYNDGTAMVSNA